MLAGEKVGDTAMSRMIERLVEILEAEEKRKAHGGVDPQVVHAALREMEEWEGGLAGSLRSMWAEKRLPREKAVAVIQDYLVRCESQTAKAKALVDEVAA